MMSQTSPELRPKSHTMHLKVHYVTFNLKVISYLLVLTIHENIGLFCSKFNKYRCKHMASKYT